VLTDAHNHLHDPRLDTCRDEFLRELPGLGLRRAVVNGTREGDWPAVAALAARVPWVVPSFGLHPWHVNSRTPGWRDALLAQLDAHPGCGVGEIGLDRWIEGHDPVAQAECFTAQLAMAAGRDLPASIHCVRAWGAMWEIIRSHPLPRRGVLLHAYGGPVEMVPGFVARGAYFSFPPYFIHTRKAAQREVFARIPPERLLVETDAPDLAPPAEKNVHPLPDHDGKPVNHPANITLAYAALAEIRDIPPAELVALVSENFARIFGQTA
jgi:TatD DNase family protein